VFSRDCVFVFCLFLSGSLSMPRATGGLLLVLTLGLFVGCNANKSELGPSKGEVQKASEADINKSMQESFQKMKEAADKSNTQRQVPDAPKDIKGQPQ
jgi:hypothetical protein